MKLISSPAHANGRLAGRGAAIYPVGCLLAAALFSTGCHKATDTTAAPAPPPAAPAPTAATDTSQDSQAITQSAPAAQTPGPGPIIVSPVANPNVPNPNAVPMAKPNGEPDFTALDSAVMGWVYANRRLPKNFADFAATAGVAIPRPPPGKKYILTQRLRVQLVNQ